MKHEKNMVEYVEMLGFKYVDRVTAFKGVAESVSFDLYGCIQVFLRAAVDPETNKIGEEAGRWFDVARLQSLDEPRVMEPPAFDREPIGPADKTPPR